MVEHQNHGPFPYYGLPNPGVILKSSLSLGSFPPEMGKKKKKIHRNSQLVKHFADFNLVQKIPSAIIAIIKLLF